MYGNGARIGMTQHTIASARHSNHADPKAVKIASYAAALGCAALTTAPGIALPLAIILHLKAASTIWVSVASVMQTNHQSSRKNQVRQSSCRNPCLPLRYMGKLTHRYKGRQLCWQEQQ